MILTILNGLLPVAFVMALGWLAGKTNVLRHEDANVLATFVIRFALPFALFASAINTSSDHLRNIPLALTLALGLMGIFVAGVIIGRLVFRHDLKTATMQGLVCAFPDMAYFGSPILLATFGPEGFLPVLLGNLVTSVVMLPTAIVLTNLAESEGRNRGWRDIAMLFARNIRSAIANPIVWLPILGVAISFSGLHLPAPVVASVETIAKAAGGTSLFALGLMLYGEKFRLNANVLTNIGLKNVLQPALMAVGTLIFGLHGPTAHQAILTGAVPTATAAAMFSLRYRAYAADATATILVSTLLGIGTAALLMALLR